MHRARACRRLHRPWGLALSPDGSRLYSANGLSNTISVIDTATGKVVGAVDVGARPWGVAVTRKR